MRQLVAMCAVVVGLGVTPAAAQSVPQAIVLESPTMTGGEMMPRDYTPDGRNLSPPLTWSNLPPGTRSLAVVCADFGAGNPPPWVHWIMYNIPPTATGLPEGLPFLPDDVMPAELAGAIQGLNGWRRPYYRGPAPPRGTPHIYHFTVYALDDDLGLEAGLDREEFLDAAEGHVIGRGDIVPIYERFASQD